MLAALITDPWFYAVAIPAVFVFGVSKGGFGGGLGVLGVPLMSLAVSPIQAAAILLPILCFMDIISTRVFWKRWSTFELWVVLPAAVLHAKARAAKHVKIEFRLQERTRGDTPKDGCSAGGSCDSLRETQCRFDIGS